MRRFFLMNLVLGAAVLGSYAQGIATHPDLVAVDALWGSMPAGLRSFYEVYMLVAAAAYFPPLVLFLRHREGTVLGGRSMATVDALYALVLIPSALWMPLTFAWLENPGPALWYLMRADLALVALGAYAQLAAIWTMKPRVGRGLFAAAMIGQVLFVVQTGLLDPWIWPLFFDPSRGAG